MSDVIIADLETNGFAPDQIWVAGILDYHTRKFNTYVGMDAVAEAIYRISHADLVIGHNFLEYDNKVLQELAGTAAPVDRVYDTLQRSRVLHKERKKHSLESWGDYFGFPKIKYTGGFAKFNPLMVPYCERDCLITGMLFDYIIERETDYGFC